MVKLSELLHSATLRQSTLTTVSTLINGVLGALFYFLLARFLGPSDYGVFTLATTILVMLSGVVDLGSDQGIVKFVPRYKDNPEKQGAIIKLLLQIKFLAGIITLLVLWLFSGPIADNILRQPELRSILPLVGFGILAQLLFSFTTSLSQALERFFVWSSLFIGTNLARLIVVLALFLAGGLNQFSAIGIYVVFPLLGFLVGLFFLDRKFLSARKTFTYLSDIFNFNKWVLAFVIVATIGSRLEIFFTTRYLGLANLGVYGLVLQIANILPQLTGAIGAVTSPKFASLNTQEKNVAYTKKAILLTTGISILGFLLLIPVGWAILNYSGPDYIRGFSPMIIVLASMALFLATSPIRDSIIYYFGKPQFFFWMGIGHALLVAVLSTVLIQRFNILGTAQVVLLGQVFIAVTSTSYFLYKSK